MLKPYRLILVFLACSIGHLAIADGALPEAESQKQALRMMQHQVHLEYGVRSLEQLEILDELVALYLRQGDYVEALSNASFAYELRMTSTDINARYRGYQSYGDVLAKSSFFGPAARVYRRGIDDQHLSPDLHVRLLVSTARLSRGNSAYLRQGVLALEQAIVMAEQHGIPNANVLRLSLADMLLVSGNVPGAVGIYESLWRLEPDNRSEWFGQPKLLRSAKQPAIEASGVTYVVKSNGRVTQTRFPDDVAAKQKIAMRKWLENSVYRPSMEQGRPQDVEINLASILDS